MSITIHFLYVDACKCKVFTNCNFYIKLQNLAIVNTIIILEGKMPNDCKILYNCNYNIKNVTEKRK